MSKIIFLNGCGSAGKTSIARAIQVLSNDLWLSFGIDTFISMLPYTKESQYFNFISGRNEQGPTMRVESTKEGIKLCDIMSDFACLLADGGHNIIIDEVLFDDEQLQKYAIALKNHQVYFIAVHCDLKVMQEREILRGDRSIGLSNDQIIRVHQGSRSNCDLNIDTTKLSSFEAASSILEFINLNSEHLAFSKIILESEYNKKSKENK